MTRLLHVAASARGAASFSRGVAESLIAALCRLDPDLIVVERDLAAAPPPHPDRDFVRCEPHAGGRAGEGERAVLALSEILIGELSVRSSRSLDADAQFRRAVGAEGLARSCRAAGTHLSATAAGKIGLLADRPVLVVDRLRRPLRRRRRRRSARLPDPYLRYVFAVIGLSSFEALRLEELKRGDERIERTLEAARRWIEAQGAGLAIDGRR